jgi:hypothetical protein
VAASPRAAEYALLEQDFGGAIAARRDAARRDDPEAFLASDARVKDIRAQAAAIVKQASEDERYNDVDFVFPTFITTRMPIGLAGLMIAAIFAAAMSASGGELNALATATIIDFYRRHVVTQSIDKHYLTVSRFATIGWASLRAWWQCLRPIKAHSSKSSTGTGRSTTGRSLASSSWRCSRSARRPGARSGG